MFLTARRVTLFFVCCLALLCNACSSNNKGKIEGKWKIVSGPGFDANTAKQLDIIKMYVYIEFKSDNTLTIGADTTDQNFKKQVAEAAKSFSKGCKYRLKSGDIVEFYDIPKEMQEKGNGGLFGNKDRARPRIRIDGDNMTMTDDSGQMNLVRLK
jgi:hypothetical protein